MDILSLRTFLVLAETGTFSQTAEILSVTQPAVSKRIANLEGSLGTRLFDRVGKKAQLTEAGERLVPGSQKIIDEMEETQRLIGNLDETPQGTLKMATSHHIGLHRLPEIIRRYTQAYPEVELDIRFMDSEQAFPALLHGDIELAIVTLPDITHAQLKQIPLWSDPMRVTVSGSHELASLGEITLDQLKKHRAILPTRGTHTREILDDAMGQHAPENILLETSYLETIRAMVAAGLGWSMLPTSMIREAAVALNTPLPDIERTLGVVYHEGRTLSNAAHSMVELISGQE